MDFKYGSASVALDLPSYFDRQVLQKDLPVSFESQEMILAEGIEQLLDQLAPRIGQQARLLLIVPDHTRRCNLPLILPLLIDALQQCFSAKIEILIANGSHAQQPEQTIIDLVSPAVYARCPVHQHDAQNKDELFYFGKTSNGTEIRLNRKVTEADFVITVGGVLYHYFAGFGGGPKMLLPGVAGYETIRQNHSLTIDRNGGFHPRCVEGNIDDNPVYCDLVQVLDFVSYALSLQVVLAPDGRIVRCEAGEIRKTQRRLIASVEQMYALPIERQADVVVASAGGFPADVNLIQAHKAIHHAFRAVKSGGCLLIAAECREGIGSQTFLPAFRHGNAAAMAKALIDDYQINSHTALTLREKAERAHIIFLSKLDQETAARTGMLPVDSPEAAIDLLKRLSPNARCAYLFPQANLYLPLLSSL